MLLYALKMKTNAYINLHLLKRVYTGMKTKAAHANIVELNHTPVVSVE